MYRALFQLFVVPILLVVVLVGGYSMYWTYIANGLRDGVEEWATSRRKEGYLVSFAELRKSGYPLRVRVTLVDPRMGRAGKELTWAWTGPRTAVEMRPWSFSRIALLASGRHELSLIRESEQWTFAGEAARLQAVVTLDGTGRPDGVTLEAAALEMRESRAGSPLAARTAYLKLTRFAGGGSSKLSPSLEVEVRGEGLVLPQQAYAPLGPAIKTLDAEAKLVGRLSGKALAEGLQRWAEAGGVLEVGRLNADWGGLSWDSNGTLALDKNLELMGAVTVQAEGLFETLEELAQARVIQRRISSVAQVVLGPLARRAPSGRTSLSLAISLQEGGLFANGIRFADVPHIAWEGVPPGLVPSGLLGLDDAPANRPRAGE
ncbi:MAG: DUF2125 domain-containing protein [Proteobacteria bacterium]|nr:DUF2125 domain-containing protein [Pseudomonadota bacterium]